MIGRTFAVWFRGFAQFTLLSAGAVSPFFALRFWEDPSDSYEDYALKAQVAGFLLLFVFVLLSACVIHAVFERLQGRKPTIRATAARGARALVPVFCIGVVAMLAIMACTLVLTVLESANAPFVVQCIAVGVLATFGIYFAIALYVGVPAAVVERRGPIDAVIRGWTLSRRCRFKILATVVVMMILNYILNIAALSPFQHVDYEVRRWFSIAWMILVMPMLAIPPAIVYHDIRRAKEGLGADAIAAIFD